MNKISLFLLFCFICINAAGQVNKNIDFRSQLDYPKPCSNIWGYVDDSGNEYALLGTWDGVSIIDVTDPDTPTTLFDVPSASPANGNLVWREIKTFQKRAYITNEQDSGLLIIDLSDLPNNVSYHHFKGNGLKTAHTLWIDENGILYLFGFNTELIPVNGAMVFDLNNNPDQPEYISQYSGAYIHDGFVRGDTLWASEIHQSKLVIFDIKNKNNFKELGSRKTPLSFTHNVWPTSDNRYVFTTDEKPNSTLASFNVSNVKAIPDALNQVQSNPGSNSIIHNVHLYSDDFAVCSYYRDGVVIFDVSHPDNMIEVGNYDTSPLSGDGFNGNWGVYPNLPSGNLILSDIEGGLFVLTPHYKFASRLEGTVTDSVTGAVLNAVKVEIISAVSTVTNYLGEYKTGIADSGKYDVKISKLGYETKIIHQVNLRNGMVTMLNVKMVPATPFMLSVTVVDSATNLPVADAGIRLTDNFQFDKIYYTNASGVATLSPIYEEVYDVFAGSWGFQTKVFNATSIQPATGNITLKLSKGYYDDFTFDLGWIKTGTASTGKWVIAAPIGTSLNSVLIDPSNDVPDDFGNKCYVTGAGGTDPSSHDVDGGTVILTSPVMDLTGYSHPFIQYYRWFADDGGSGLFPIFDDTLKVTLTNGTETKVIDTIGPYNKDKSKWIFSRIDVSNYLTPSSNMKIIFSTADKNTSGNLVKAAVDKFEVVDTLYQSVGSINGEQYFFEIYPNPFNRNISLRYNFSDNENKRRIIVTDIMGRTLQSYNLKTSVGQIEMGKEMEPGVYFISLLSDDKVILTRKAMKF